MFEPEEEIDLFLNELAKQEQAERENNEAWEEYLEDRRKIREQVDLIIESIFRWIKEGG